LLENQTVAVNRTFLGDALDFWKGGLLDHLQRAEALEDLLVDGMFTDPPWDEESLSLYSRLLRVPASQVVQHEERLSHRADYIDEISADGDVFLDPDTGIQTSGHRTSMQHLGWLEIARLLERPERLLVVYQHVSRATVESRVGKVCSFLHGRIHGLHCCSANSATVAMVFVSRDLGRIEGVSKALQRLYGPKALSRHRLWPCA